MAVAGNLVINLMGNTQNLAKKLAQGQAMVRGFNVGASASLTSFASRAVAAFAAVGAAIKRFMALLLSAMVVLGQFAVIATAMAIAKTIEYDDALRSAGARARATEKELKDLDDRARMLGRTTSFTATQVASLMEKLGQGGFKVPEIIDMTDDVMNLARATGTDAAMSAELMATTMRVFGIAANDAGRVADVFTGVANRTLTSVEELAEGWKFAAKPAADLGMSLEETAAVMGTLSQMGLKGSIAGTAIRLLSAVSAAEAGKLEKQFGIKFKDAAGNARPLLDIMADISVATKSLGSADRMTEFFEAFGLRGVTATSGLADNVMETDNLVAALQAAGGEAAATAAKMDAGIGGAWRRFKSAVEGMALMLGEVLTPGFITAMDAIRDKMNETTDWLSANWTSVMNDIATVITIGMTYADFAIENWKLLAAIAFTTVILAIRKFGNVLIHIFTVVVPTAASWFAENFVAIMKNSIGFVFEQFRKLSSGFMAIWTALLDWFDNKGFNPDFSGMKDQFQSHALTAFDLPDRVKGKIEKETEEVLGKLKKSAGSKLDTMMHDRLTELKRLQDEAAAQKLNDTKPEDPLSDKRRYGAGGSERMGTGDAGIAGAQMRGSTEALMTILKSPGAKTDEMMLAIQKKHLAIAKAAAEAEKKQAKATPVVLNVVGAP